MPSWSRVATRLRVPVRFIFAAVYLWIARPTWIFLVAGSAVVLAGLGVRAMASGYIPQKCRACHHRPLCLPRATHCIWAQF